MSIRCAISDDTSACMYSTYTIYTQFTCVSVQWGQLKSPPTINIMDENPLWGVPGYTCLGSVAYYSTMIAIKILALLILHTCI